MPYSHILFETSPDGIALITVNRPQKLNALNSATQLELADAFTHVRGERSLRAVIVTGAGEKAFVAGSDINEIAALEPIAAQAFAERGQRIVRLLETLGKPSVAAINGFALGGGLELAMACTVRFACPEAKLGQPEIKLGILPGHGGTQRLPHLVGRGRALEMLLTGDPVDAAEAYRIGLVNAVVARDQLLAHGREWLGKILANAPLATGLIMEAVDVGLNSSQEEGMRYEAAAFGLAAATADGREGTRAFLEKRKPAFAGK
jgi:enoyl-CoA hydratase